MGKNIDNINQIFEDIEVHICQLLGEQVPNGFIPDESDEEDAEVEVQKIKDKDAGKNPLSQRTKEFTADIMNGEKSIVDIIPAEDQKTLQDLLNKGNDYWDKNILGYTITGGKYAGVVVSKAIAIPLRVAMIASSPTSILKNPLKSKAAPDICNCVALAKKYTSGPNDCIDKRTCRSNFLKGFKGDIKSLYVTDRETAIQYYEDCRSRYAGTMFITSNREAPDFKKGCKAFKTMLDSQKAVTADLSNLLSKYFRIKNHEKNKETGDRTVADKIVVYASIEINFDDSVEPQNNPTFSNCESNSTLLKDNEKFDIMSASSLSQGKTVELKKGNKRCLMTFNNATRGEPNAGTITWIDKTSKSPICASYSWKGRIIKFYT